MAQEQISEQITDLQQQGQETAETLWSTLPEWTQTLISVGAVVAGAILLNILMRLIIRRFLRRITSEHAKGGEEDKERRQTIGMVLRTVSSLLIWTIAFLLALSYGGVNLGPFIAAAGIGGVAIGFGAQNLVRDFLAGFFIILEDQYHVGDIIRIANVSGEVEKVTLRATVLRDLDGQVHNVPNGEITVSSNFTKGFSRYLLDLPVPYEEDVDRAVEIVKEAFEDMRKEPDYTGIILGPLTVLGVNDYSASEILVRMYLETLPGRQWYVGREFRRRIKKAYDEAGISIPFPHRELIIKPAPQEEEEP